MSVVTNVIMVCSLSDGELEGYTNNLESIRKEFYLERVDHLGGGNKAIQGAIYIGAFNYLDRDKLINAIRSLNWEIPIMVQLMFQGEWDDKYKIVDIFPDAPTFN